MNVIIAFAIFASLVNGAAVPATTVSIDRATPVSLNPLNTQHVNVKRDVELGNEEYMSMWWSGQDIVNQQSYSAQEHSIALNQPALALPEAPRTPSSSAYLSSLSASLSSQSSSFSTYLSSLSSASLSASLSSEQKCSKETLAPTSEPHLQSQSISIVEESRLPIAPEPANAAPSNVVVNSSVCRTGMMRCAGDGSFDTCLFGKWGTVRLCAQGTKCISQDDNYIACTY